MTWTSAFGRACGWLLDRIVHGLALTKISPNALTFIGLVINIVAAFLFGHADPTNAGRMFFYAGCVIFGAGLFDMVGLVWEWTLDFNAYAITAESRDPNGKDGAAFCGGAAAGVADLTDYPAFMRFSI